MSENIKELLNEEIAAEIQAISSLDSGSEKKSKAIEDLAKLYRLRIEESKNELDAEDKRSRRTLESEATVACSSGAGTGLNRRELYTDARDVSSTVDNETLTDAEYKAQLSQRGLENLAENIATKSFEGKVETTRMYRYGEDFFLGDMVQIVNEYGIEGKARVTEFIRSQSKEGLDSYPTFVTVE